MRGLTAAEIAKFDEQGVLTVPGYFAGTRLLDDISTEVTALGRVFDSRFDPDSATRRIEAFKPGARKSFYNGLRCLASLTRLCSSDELMQTSRDLGLKLPALMRSHNIRMDMPRESEQLFHWHQDISYLLGSLNSLTYWVPLGRVDRTFGSVEVIPGSHRRGLEPLHYTGVGKPPKNKVMGPTDLRLIREPRQPGDVIEADRGDLVVFSQFIMHRSVANQADRVRWTAQVRHTDLAESEFVAAGYPLGDATNVYHTRYLPQAATI
jgi:Phytanoyl-CoA dioxygenase (PhyH)